MTEPSDAGSGSPSTTTAGAENVAAQKTEPAGGEQDPDGEALDRKLMDLTEEGDDDEQEKIDLDEEMAVIQAAIEAMPTPPGLKRAQVPKKSSNRSILYDFGVRYDQDAVAPNPKKQKWYCMASPSCRRESAKALASGGIHVEVHATGNATRHLSLHKIESRKTRMTRKAKASQDATDSKGVQQQPLSTLNTTDQQRDLALLYVKAFIISHLFAFNLAESKHIPSFLSLACISAFPSMGFNSKTIQHYVIEIYSATVSRLLRSLKDVSVGGPILHATFDLWTSNVSNEKFIVKPFRPSSTLSDRKKLSDALLMWVTGVFQEYNIAIDGLFCTVTEGSSDPSRLCLKIESSKWEWSFPQMLHSALVEAFGTPVPRPACGNASGRAIMQKIKDVVDYIKNLSDSKVDFGDAEQASLFGSSTKLADVVPSRWMSICDVLERVLREWGALEAHYANDGNAAFPLADMLSSVEELFSLLKPVALLIKSCQRMNVPTGVSSFLEIVALRSSVLKEGKPLLIQSPRQSPTKEQTSQADVLCKCPRDAQALQEVTVNTRTALARAIDRRFFDKRYSEDATEGATPDYLFEMGACMHPFLASLPFLGGLCSSASHSDNVRAIITGKVLDLMANLAESAEVNGESEGQGGKRKGAGSQGDARRGKKRKSLSSAETDTALREAYKEAQHLIDSGMFGEIGDDAAPDHKREKTLRDRCAEEFETFVMRGKHESLKTIPISGMLNYWAGEGVNHYPRIARAARVLLSLPASSAVVEHDFSTCGRLADVSRSREDAAYAEMVLFLHGNQEDIPEKVPALTPEQARSAIPKRLSNHSEEVFQLSRGLDDKEDGDLETDEVRLE